MQCVLLFGLTSMYVETQVFSVHRNLATLVFDRPSQFGDLKDITRLLLGPDLADCLLT